MGVVPPMAPRPDTPLAEDEMLAPMAPSPHVAMGRMVPPMAPTPDVAISPKTPIPDVAEAQA